MPVTFTGPLSHPDIAAILADSLALEQARTVRQRLTPRCALLALLAAICALGFPAVAAGVRWASAPLCLVPPAWAWVIERRIARRLSDRLAQGRSKKVIKSP
ncbi:MAG: hypothetical protein ABL971_09370 [Vicinamibacterales bacterium]